MNGDSDWGCTTRPPRPSTLSKYLASDFFFFFKTLLPLHTHTHTHYSNWLYDRENCSDNTTIIFHILHHIIGLWILPQRAWLPARTDLCRIRRHGNVVTFSAHLSTFPLSSNQFEMKPIVLDKKKAKHTHTQCEISRGSLMACRVTPSPFTFPIGRKEKTKKREPVNTLGGRPTKNNF